MPQVVRLEAELRKARDDLTGLYKDNADVAKEALDKADQLQVVRCAAAVDASSLAWKVTAAADQSRAAAGGQVSSCSGCQ